MDAWIAYGTKTGVTGPAAMWRRCWLCLLAVLAISGLGQAGPGLPASSLPPAIANGALGQLPCFAGEVALDASPSGRYIAVSGSNANAQGEWLYDTVDREWRQLHAHAVAEKQVQWLPDETGFITANHDQSHTLTTFYYSRLDGTVQNKELTTLKDTVEWKIIPDGSGIVATTVEQRQDEEEGLQLRGRVELFDFATSTWREVAVAEEWTSGEGTGDHLALRKDGNDWVLSYHANGPSDSRSYWVNLTSGKAMLAEEGDPVFDYTPDGQYVVAMGAVWKANSWPQPPFDSYSGGKVVIRPALSLPLKERTHFTSSPLWAPDSRRLLTAWYDGFKDYPSGYQVTDIISQSIVVKKAFPENTLHLDTWVGSEQILFHTYNSTDKYYTYYLETLTGEREPLFTMVRRSD